MWVFRDAADKRDAREKPAERFGEDEQRLIAGRGVSSAASITEPMLRQEVGRDIDKLLNTIALESIVTEIVRLPHIRTSILNYGLADIAHRSIDELQANDKIIERDIERALKTYESRLIPDSIAVRRDDNASNKGVGVCFTVKADLLCRPIDIPVEFTAEVEANSSKFSIRRL